MSQQVVSLWGDEFTIPSTKDVAKNVIKKIKEQTDDQKLKSKKVDNNEKISIITEKVHHILGKYAQNTQVIKTREELHSYISEAINNEVIAIDTETNNSLDPLTCKLMGGCIYTPNLRNAYIPVNHVNPNTQERLDWQLTEKDIKEEFQRLEDEKIKIIMHNASFDYQVIKCTCDITLTVHWDTMLGARILDENERAGLKGQYIDKIDPSIEKYSIEGLFSGMEYAIFDPDLFALYAATDAYMTYRLYEWQKEKFSLPDNSKIYYIFSQIEMPLLPVTAEMELRGVCIDKEYAGRLSKKYHSQLDKLDEELSKELELLRPEIQKWRLTSDANKKSIKISNKGEEKVGKSKSEQLEDPVNLGSPSQLSILLYDVLKLPSVDKKNPRGTGEDILKKLADKGFSLGKAILKKRGAEKLLNTFVDKLPSVVSPKDGRLHAHFQQAGTDTGRFSSSEPNLQNIPSHARDVRMMFSAAPGYKFVGADFSQAEPRLLAWYSQDEKMIDAYINKKDLYATVASTVFNNKYEDNLEFFPDGTMNNAGKERRTFCKSIILGIMYGRGAASIAEQVGKSIKEAQEIIDQFYKGFPKVKEWVDNTQANCKITGYTETLWGRRRRLPDIQLPKYSIKLRPGVNVDKYTRFNPLIGVNNEINEKDIPVIKKYEKIVAKEPNKFEIERIKKEAEEEGVEILNNQGFIAQAERQAVNARVQGGSADITKRAMIKVFNDPLMKELGFNLLLCIHDELIGEVPEENAEAAAKRLSELMLAAPLPECKLPFKCDSSIIDHWYEEEYDTLIQVEYSKLLEKNNKETSFNTICKDHCESTPETLQKIIDKLPA